MLCDMALCRLRPQAATVAAVVVEQPLVALLGSMVLALPAQPLSVCVQVQQPLVALLGSMVLALPAQPLSVCEQVQQPLVALLGSMVLALPAQLLSLPLSLSLLIHCVGKANMAGAAPVAQTLVSISKHSNPNMLACAANPNLDMLGLRCKRCGWSEFDLSSLTLLG